MKISVITVCYNSEKTIKGTIESVLNQTYTNFEYIIVDGKSSDNTLNIIKSYKDKRIHLLSENDNGLYDAMNKGIYLAIGDIIAIINSDDIYANDNVFETVVNNFDNNTDVVYANIKYCSEDFKKVIRNFKSGKKKNILFNPAHPSMFVRKEVYQKYDVYNTEYKIAADYDFMIRINKANINYKYIDDCFVLMRYGGKSNGIGYLNNFKEVYNIYKKNDISFPLFNTIKKSFLAIKQILNS